MSWIRCVGTYEALKLCREKQITVFTAFVPSWHNITHIFHTVGKQEKQKKISRTKTRRVNCSLFLFGIFAIKMNLLLHKSMILDILPIFWYVSYGLSVLLLTPPDIAL